ncbi:MAG: hypothetical protein OXU64_08780 [Gemmatimonadota bacterium]|nr:hypothetical protein [Gemmatimonadota bacterium]
MTAHWKERGRGPRALLIAGAAVLAAAIPVWMAVESAERRPRTEPVGGKPRAAERGRGAAPPGTPLFDEVASVTDAAAHRGMWFVLDRRGAKVHRFDEFGSLLGSFGRGGEGPGEFRRPAAIAAHGDTLVVVDGRVLHEFRMDGGHIADRTIRLGGCGHGVVKDALSLSAGLLLLVNCATPDSMGWMVVEEPRNGPARTLAVRARDPGVVDLGMAWAVIGAHPRGFVFGLPEHDCLGLFGPRGGASGRICHEWIERLPFPEGFEEAAASLRERVGRSGARLVESDRLPPFNRVFLVAGDRLAYQVPLPERIEVFRLVTRGASGEAVAFPLPAAEGLFAAGSSALLWWEDLGGMRIAVRPLDAP